MGSPDKLSPAQLAKLQSLTRDLPEKNQVVRVSANGRYSLTVPMRSNDVVLVTLDRN
jgi:xylan 1,4-beta-xylosidase